jgi:predicted MFS family arabinose efflux permease
VGGAAAAPALDGVQSPAYQVLLVTLLSVTFGIVFFDRNSLGFLMPFIQGELHLSDTEVGMLSSALSLTWACAAFGIGYVSDRTGSRKGLLIIATVLFSACSFLSGLAMSFAILLGARLLMGVAEGGMMPIMQSIVAVEVRPEHRGLAMGVTQNFGSNLLGTFLAPVVLTAVATAYGWRHAFFLAGIPGLVAAILLWRFLRPPRELQAPSQGIPGPAQGAAAHGTPAQARADPARPPLREVCEERNVVLCALMAIVLVSNFVICLTFMPLYLTQVRHFTPDVESWLIAGLGLSATAGAFVISALSDRIGRRPLMIAMPIIGVILPLGAIYYLGSVWVLGAIFVVGWGLTGIFPLFMATVPSESVDPHLRATALGICMGTGEILGGVLAPSIAGYAADRMGLQAPLWIMLGLTLVGAALAFGLRETAPRVLARRARLPA